MALATKMDKQKNKTYVLMGDGETQEGSVWEAAMCAGKYKLSHLTAVIDYNKHQSYGSTYEVQDLEPFGEKWRSFGFSVREVDGHDVEEIRSALTNVPFHENHPGVLICHTVKGKGVPFAENNLRAI